jgi:Spy/CpxP family protein refolding chaperone
MKYLKLMLFALIMAFTFVSAQAQVVVRAHIGPGYHHHHWHHRHWHHYHRY